MTVQALLNAQTVVSWLTLWAFVALLAYEVRMARWHYRPMYGVRVSWLVHGIIFYIAASIARSYGIRVGDVSATLFFTLWSSALRLHFLIGIWVAIRLNGRK